MELAPYIPYILLGNDPPTRGGGLGKLFDIIDIEGRAGPDGTLSPGYVLRPAATGFDGTLSLLLLLVVDRAALLVKLVARAVEFPPIIRKTASGAAIAPMQRHWKPSSARKGGR